MMIVGVPRACDVVRFESLPLRHKAASQEGGEANSSNGVDTHNRSPAKARIVQVSSALAVSAIDGKCSD